MNLMTDEKFPTEIEKRRERDRKDRKDRDKA
jgi:hypothetical protein